MIDIRSGSGLGDSLYLQGVVRELVNRGETDITVRTNFPDVFHSIKDHIHTVPFTKENTKQTAVYTLRMGEPTSYFQDCCISAGLQGSVDFKMDWSVKNTDLIAELKSHNKPILLVQMVRKPMARDDGFAENLVPNCDRIQEALDQIGDKAYKVLIGAGENLHPFEGIDLDLSNKTTLHDILDLGYSCDAMLGYCSFMVPLAEQFSKNVLFIWSRKGLKDKHSFVRKVTPRKVLHRKSSRYVIDDCTPQELEKAVNEIFKEGPTDPIFPWENCSYSR